MDTARTASLATLNTLAERCEHVTQSFVDQVQLGVTLPVLQCCACFACSATSACTTCCACFAMLCFALRAMPCHALPAMLAVTH